MEIKKYTPAEVSMGVVTQAVLGIPAADPNQYKKWVERHRAKVIYRQYEQGVRDVYASRGMSGRIHPKLGGPKGI